MPFPTDLTPWTIWYSGSSQTSRGTDTPLSFRDPPLPRVTFTFCFSSFVSHQPRPAVIARARLAERNNLQEQELYETNLNLTVGNEAA